MELLIFWLVESSCGSMKSAIYEHRSTLKMGTCFVLSYWNKSWILFTLWSCIRIKCWQTSLFQKFVAPAVRLISFSIYADCEFFVRGQILSFKIMELNLFVCFYCQLYCKRTDSVIWNLGTLSLCVLFFFQEVGWGVVSHDGTKTKCNTKQLQVLKEMLVSSVHFIVCFTSHVIWLQARWACSFHILPLALVEMAVRVDSFSALLM